MDDFLALPSCDEAREKFIICQVVPFDMIFFFKFCIKIFIATNVSFGEIFKYFGEVLKYFGEF